MEYLPQRRWSSLEKKRAHIKIKAIDKQLKERRMMRSLENFIVTVKLENLLEPTSNKLLYNSTAFCRIWGCILVTAFCSCILVTAFRLLKVAFCLLEDLTVFCLKISLHFASRPHSVLIQDIHCVLLEDLTTGKENGLQILQSIDQGPFKLGTTR
ncbi:hypothetical protein Tco_0695141, partial [Tanacetum coccineum]